MNLAKIIRPLRRLLFYGAVLAMAIDLIGGGLFALDSLGSAAAFTVGYCLNPGLGAAGGASAFPAKTLQCQ